MLSGSGVTERLTVHRDGFDLYKLEKIIKASALFCVGWAMLTGTCGVQSLGLV